MDFLTILIWVAFYALFAVSIQRYLRYRTVLDRSVMLVFSSSAALFAVSAINTLVPGLAPVLSPVAVTLLVAQPVLMFGLVGLFVRLPGWAIPTAIVGFAVSLIGYYATNRSVAATLFLVAYFAITEALAALTLVREARRRHGFPRIRLAMAGIASLLFGLGIFLSGASSAARGGTGADPAVTLVVRSLTLVAGLGYLAAFAPPHWLVQIAHRALAFDLVRSIVASPTGSLPTVHWQALAAAAAQILGMGQVRITDAAGVLAEEATSQPDGTKRMSRFGPLGAAPVEIPLVVDGRLVATLSADLDNQALFIEDDIALLATLGSLTARTVERERAVADLAEATRAVAEATAVRASEARFRALLDAEPNAILAVDSTGRIRWSTQSAADMFGLSEAELAQRTLDDLVASRSESASRRSGSTQPVRYETSGRRANGESFPAEIALTTFDFDNEPHRLAVISDISWRHEANAIRERFIGVLSHELRTPITAIFGGTQVLLSRGNALDEATQRELLTDVAGESERLQRMIENLLVLARVEGGNEVAESGPVLLHRVLPNVVPREQAMWPGMSIVIEAPTTLPPVMGDEASLSLVIRNLISNAGKYAGAGASVRLVVTSEPPSGVSVRVLDNGPGIEADESERLFDLYFRSKKNHSVPGSGIGLFVCQQLVAAMGGRMWARRRAEGGSEFGFTLPVYTESDEPIVDRLNPREQARPARATAVPAPLPATPS